MQEGTSIGLMTLVTMIGFGILFGTLFTLLPEIRETALRFITDGVNTPTPL